MSAQPPAIVQTGRRLHERYMLDRLVVLKRTTTKTSGGTTTTYPERGDGELPCGFGQVTDREASLLASSVVAGKALSGIKMPLRVDRPDEGDRVRNLATGKEWVVVGDLTPESAMAVIARIIVREV